MSLFSKFPLLPTVQATLIEKSLVTPTEIQLRSLPLLLAGQSVVGVSETGSGKTLAYGLPLLHQLGLFSATVSSSVQTLMNKLFSEAVVIRSSGSHRTVSTLKTSNRKVEDGKRFVVLEKVLAEPSLGKTLGGTLIFTNTREQCDKLAKQLLDSGRLCLLYRGEMEKVERRANLKSFRDGKINLLVATDLASRGLDVEHVDRVINYHLPRELDNYLHRVGRTARAGRNGLVVNLVTERDAPLLEKVANLKA